MSLTDIILIVLFLSFVVAGIHRGFVRSLGSVIGTVIGFFAARAFAPWLGGLLDAFLPGDRTVLVLISFILIYLIIERLIAFLFGLLGFVFTLVARLPILAQINKLLGFLLGILEGVIVLGSVIYMIGAFRVDLLLPYVSRSLVAGWLQYGFSVMLGYLL